MPSGPDIDALKALVTHNQSLADWATLLVVFGLLVEIAITFAYTKDKPRSEIILGVIAGTIIAIGCFGEFRYGSRAAEGNAKLRTAADLRIAELTKNVGDTQLSSEAAADAAKRATDSSRQAELLAHGASEEANSVKKAVGQASQQLTELRKSSEDLEAQANKTKDDLVNLGVCSAPRIITPWQFGSGGIRVGWGVPRAKQWDKSYIDPLTPMKGQIVLIEFVPEPEAYRAALNIAGALQDAEWIVKKPLIAVPLLNDGVSVQPSAPPSAPPSLPGKGAYSSFEENNRANETASKLLDFLHSYDWEADLGSPLDNNGKMIRDPIVIPGGAIRIQVGLYPPMVHEVPPGQKPLEDLLSKRAQLVKEMAESQDKESEARLERNGIKKEEVERWREEHKAEIKRYINSGPCQNLYKYDLMNSLPN